MKRSTIRSRCKRVAILACAFGVGLVAADRMMSARLLADSASQPTIGPATDATTVPSDSQPASRPAVPAEVRAWLDALRVAPPIAVEGTLRQQFDVAGVTRDNRIEIHGSAKSPTEFRHVAKGSVEVVADGKRVTVLDPESRQFRGTDLGDRVPDDVLAILRQQNPLLALAVEPDAERALLPNDATNVRRIDADSIGLDADGIHVTLRRGADGKLAGVGYDFGDSIKARGATAVRSAMALIEYAKVEPRAEQSYRFDAPRDSREVAASPASKPTTRGDKLPSTTEPADD